jgi:integrase
MYKAIHSGLTFAKAAERWLYARARVVGNARYISPRYVRDLQQYVEVLNRTFCKVRLKNITVGRLRQYQLERAESCGPNKINQELGALIQIMKRGDAWSGTLDRCYEPLKRQYSEVRHAMTPEEQARFLEVASEREEWSLVYHYSLLALATTASNAEMRGLHLSDIDLNRRLLSIRREHAKNRHRVRTIPMNDQAIWAASRLIERAMTIGAGSPDHCLFPFRCSPGEWDPERPMSSSGMKKGWEIVRRAAGLPWLRIHDLRHTAITRMAEAGVPIPVIMGVSGHMSVQMHNHYTAVSLVAKWHAVQTTMLETFTPRETSWPNKKMRGATAA